MYNVTILIPTKDRQEPLATTLASVLSQTYKNFSIIISDQSEKCNIFHSPTIQTIQRIFQLHGNKIKIYRNFPILGIAQQRDFLLRKNLSKYCLFLDDDCILEPTVLEHLVTTIEEQQCGFVGEAAIGLSYLQDIRPNQQKIELWDGDVVPEDVSPNSTRWKRYMLHNAANILHVQQELHVCFPTPYKIAWVGGCVLYNAKKLCEVGGFSFWKDLPKEHAGEDVLAQHRVMKKYGGCGIIPSGVYHQELPTTVKNRKVNARMYINRNYENV